MPGREGVITVNSASKKSGFRYEVLSIMLAAALIVMSGCAPMAEKQLQTAMTTYLHDRYGIEFEVGRPYVTGSMSAAHYEAKAHPGGKPELEFLVRDVSPPDKPGTGKFADYYLEAKWSYQGKQEVEKKLRETYGEGADIRIASYKFMGNYAFKDLDYPQVFEKFRDGLISLHYVIFMDGTQFSKEAEAKKAYPILKTFILDNGEPSYHFSVTYVDKAFKQEYLDNHRSEPGYVRHGDTRKLELGFLQADYITNKPIVIKSDSDLVKFFKY